jgi:CheY-like chemotaxis protein
MVISSSENLRVLLENIKSLNFLGRLFGWRRIEELHAVAYNEFKTITNEMEAIYAQNNLAHVQIRQLYSDLENQKNESSQLKAERDALRNSTGNIYDVLVNRENELSALKESEQRNVKRLIELEQECERLRAVIDQYIQLFQEKENELSHLKVTDVKNTQRILELNRESDKLQSAIEQFAQKIKESDPEAFTKADFKNTKKGVRSHGAVRDIANSIEKRILLVDDDSDFSKMLEDLLREIGYTVIGIAANGEQAIAMAGREHNLDLILVDIHIDGDMDGIETARKIRGLYGTPTIFMTAHADDETILRVVMTESDGYLVKPINRQELFANIEMAIHKKRRNDTFTGRCASINP